MSCERIVLGVDGARIGLGLLLLIAAMLKASDRRVWRRVIQAIESKLPRLGLPLAVMLILVEGLVGVWLISGRNASAAVIAFLFIVGAGTLITMADADLEGGCDCFGALDASMTRGQLILRNTAFLILGALILIALRGVCIRDHASGVNAISAAVGACLVASYFGGRAFVREWRAIR